MLTFTDRAISSVNAGAMPLDTSASETPKNVHKSRPIVLLSPTKHKDSISASYENEFKRHMHINLCNLEQCENDKHHKCLQNSKVKQKQDPSSKKKLPKQSAINGCFTDIS
jgi:hypothetical protein